MTNYVIFKNLKKLETKTSCMFVIAICSFAILIYPSYYAHFRTDR